MTVLADNVALAFREAVKQRERAEKAEAHITVLRDATDELAGAAFSAACDANLPKTHRLWLAHDTYMQATTIRAAEKLLARLKAAEAVCEAAGNAYDTIMTKANWNPEHFDTLYRALEAWCRAMGDKNE